MKKKIMIIRNIVKEIWVNNPYILYKRNKYIKACRSKFDYNNNPSIICSTCIGGIIYHNLGLRFSSPTINLWMDNKDFLKFINDIKGYLESELLIHSIDKGYPIGILKDIKIHFNHYKTFEEAKHKWDERKTRIDFNNIYIMMGDEGLSYDEIISLKDIKCNKIVVFTAKEYRDINYTYQLKRYQRREHVGLYALRDLDGFREFEKSFDYISWLNN